MSKYIHIKLKNNNVHIDNHIKLNKYIIKVNLGNVRNQINVKIKIIIIIIVIVKL